MRLPTVGFAMIVASASLVPAQGEIRERLDRLERRAVDVRSQEQELIELLNRHERGDDVSDTRWLTVTDVDLARAENAGAAGSATNDARTAALRSELAQLDASVAAARIRARDRAMGDSLPRPEELARLADRARTAPATPEAAAPLRAADDEPVRIRGSVDHLRVGCALLESGIELLREAAELDRQGRAAVAEPKRAEARARLEAARTELEPLAGLRGPDVPLLAVFSLARVEERLGRIAVADALYAVVMERDRQLGADGLVSYGPFGRSARTARTVMEWMRDTSDWRPRRDVDRIQWDDR